MKDHNGPPGMALRTPGFRGVQFKSRCFRVCKNFPRLLLEEKEHLNNKFFKKYQSVYYTLRGSKLIKATKQKVGNKFKKKTVLKFQKTIF